MQYPEATSVLSLVSSVFPRSARVQPPHGGPEAFRSRSVGGRLMTGFGRRRSPAGRRPSQGIEASSTPCSRAFPRSRITPVPSAPTWMQHQHRAASSPHPRPRFRPHPRWRLRYAARCTRNAVSAALSCRPRSGRAPARTGRAQRLRRQSPLSAAAALPLRAAPAVELPRTTWGSRSYRTQPEPRSRLAVQLAALDHVPLRPLPPPQ
jgi:hypothetical protein